MESPQSLSLISDPDSQIKQENSDSLEEKCIKTHDNKVNKPASNSTRSTSTSVTFTVTPNAARHGGAIIIANPFGWKYKKESNKTGKYWICTSTGCKGRLITGLDLTDLSSFKPKGIHSCSPKQAAQLNIELSKSVKLLAMQRPNDHAVDLAMEAINRVLSNNTTKPICGLISKENLVQQVYRKRGYITNKITEKDNILTAKLKKEQFPDEFYRWDIMVTEGTDVCRHVFFATEKQIAYLAMATEWRIDFTSKMVALPFTQLITLHSAVNLGDKVKEYMLGFILMSGKRKEDYKQVFEEIVKTLETERGLIVNVKSFLLDYDMYTWRALREVFGDGVTIRGCWFHISQAVIRKIHNVGLMGAYHAHEDVYWFTKQLSALPLLDAGNIPDTFKDMVKNVCKSVNYTEQDFYDLEKRKSIERPALVQVFQYFEDQWIAGSNFTPRDWTCYQKEIRANNNLETLEKQMSNKGSDKGMHIFKLSTFLHKQTQKLEKTDFKMDIWGVYDNYKIAGQKRDVDRIKKLWKQYEAGLDPSHLLKQASEISDPYIPPDVQKSLMNDLAL